MPSYDQLPGDMNLSLVRGDDFSVLIDFDPISLVGYTVTASVLSTVDGSVVTPFTVTVTSESAGQVNLALSDSQTAAISRGTYRWNLVWVVGTATRTAMNGFVEVI